MMQLEINQRASSRAKAWWRPALLLVIAVALGLRLSQLGSQELRGDEAFGYFFSLDSFAGIVRKTFEQREPHPVANYFLQSVWLGLAGHTEFALRYISVWFGVLAVPLLYQLARQLRFSKATAVLVAALMAASPYTIGHSQDARMYGMSLTLTLASTWLALQADERQRRALWLAYTAVSWLALHTHYFAAFVLVVQNLFVLSRALFTRQAGRAARWLAAQGVLTLAYLPWLWQAYTILTDYGGTGDSPDFVAMLWRTLSVFALGEAVPVEQRGGFAVLAALLLLVGLARLIAAGPRPRWAAWLLFLYLCVPVGLSWVGALNRPIFNERYLIAAVPPFYLLLAAAVGGLTSRTTFRIEQVPARFHPLGRGIAGLALALLVLGIALSLNRHYTDPAYSKNNGWRELATAIHSASAGLPEEQVRLAINFPDPTLLYYTGPVDHVVLPPTPHDAAASARVVEALATGGVERIILPIQPAAWWDDQRIASSTLAAYYTLIDERPVGDWPLQIYSRANPEALVPVEAAYANGLVLEASAVRPTEGAKAGGVLAIHLRWHGESDTLVGTEKLFIHILDSNGTLVAQTDPALTREVVTTPVVTYGIRLPETLPPGEYRVIGGLYDPDQPGAPRLLTASGRDSVELNTIVIRAEEEAG
jgi:hypothetical protein